MYPLFLGPACRDVIGMFSFSKGDDVCALELELSKRARIKFYEEENMGKFFPIKMITSDYNGERKR